MFPLKNWKKFKNGYVFRQLTWYCRHHLGLDKICPCGTEILMPFTGKIKKLEGIQGGNTIWIYPDDQNIVIRILHCELVMTSGRYEEGEIIGWAGNTGLSRACHIHLDISKNKINIWNINNFIDPEKFNFNSKKIMLKLIREKGRSEIYAVINNKNYYLARMAFEDLLVEKLVSWEQVKEVNRQINIEGVIK